MLQPHETDSHGHLDGCCQKEAQMQAERAKIDAVLAKHDPVRRQLQLRQIATPWNELQGAPPLSAHTSAPLTAVSPSDTHQKEEEDASDSDFGMDEEMLADFREKRLAELKVSQSSHSNIPPSNAQSRIREVGEEQFSDQLKSINNAIVMFFTEGKSKSKSVELMRGYLDQISNNPRFRDVEFWAVSVQPGSNGSWSRAGVLLQLMVPCLPALVSFRNKRVINRCVGEFGDVFPDFLGNPSSVKLWVSSQGFPSPQSSAPSTK